MNWVDVLFTVNFSILLLHEMDAIHAKEWKMFIILKSMNERTAYIIFSIIHLPLYFWVILTISQAFSSGYALVYLLTDVFLIAHMVVHFFFRKHSANNFSPVYSNVLIYTTGIIALIHLIMIF
ncbi:MAG: hypothetical protein LBH88_02860 [Candidatus Methanoplasma sp.]|jgi:hypothetical protein|nr:hypothetical protein [Candidatus Methanoplasma sp.]